MNGNLAYKDKFYAFREELIGGKVVMMHPAPTNHNRVTGNISCIFANYLIGKECEAFGFDETVFLTEVDHFIPDFMVVCDPEKVKPDGVYGAPDLVAEVLSPSTMRNDKARKKDVYAKCGVKEYWLVNPSSRHVDVYLSTGADLVFHDVHVLLPDHELAKMTEEERAAVETHFKCSLFDDLDIPLDEIFDRTF